MSPVKVCGHPVQKAEVRVWPAQSQPEDCLQGKLQVSGPREVSSKPGRHHAAAGRGVLEVTHTFIFYDHEALDLAHDGPSLEMAFYNVA